MKELTREEIGDILYGCAIMGTGGGGKVEEGLRLIDRALASGGKFVLADLGELAEEDLLVSPYYCGSVSPGEVTVEDNTAALKIDGDTAVVAVQAVENYVRRPIRGLVATELGGANTAVAFYAAAILNKIVIDGDPAGRAVPMLQHSTYYLTKVPMTPASIVNQRGDVAIFTHAKDDLSAETLIRNFAMESGNIIAVADHCVEVRVARKALIGGTVTFAHRLGQIYRETLENGGNTADKVAEAARGQVIFSGTLRKQIWEEKGGFTCGNLYIEGQGKYDRREMRIWIQNENIMSWLDGQPYVMVPELISVFNARTGEIITNPFYSNGMPLTVIGMPAEALWESEAGLKLFGPSSFGFDIEYESKLKR